MQPDGQQGGFPARLARGVMWALPPPVLAAGATALLRHMGRRHASLFRALAALPPARIRVEPTDLPHRFLLTLGGGPPRLALARPTDPPAGSCIKGSLEALIDLLEGRLDGDTLFFSRALTITGDTAAVVALRNLLDRDSIDLLSETVSLFGPFAGPVRGVVLRLEHVADTARARLVAAHAALHAAVPAPSPSPAMPELAALRTEQRRLAGRLARFERRQRHEPEDEAA